MEPVLRNRPELSSRFHRSESRQDFRNNCGVPKLLASFATEFFSGLFLKRQRLPDLESCPWTNWSGVYKTTRCFAM